MLAFSPVAPLFDGAEMLSPLTPLISEVHNSPNLSRLSSRLGNSFNLSSHTTENLSDVLKLTAPASPTTPPSRKHRSLIKTTPPSPTVLRDMTNERQEGFPVIKRRCLYSPRRSNSVSSLNMREQLCEDTGVSCVNISESPPRPRPLLNLRKRPLLTSSTSSLPNMFAQHRVDANAGHVSLHNSLGHNPLAQSCELINVACADEKQVEERVPCILPVVTTSSSSEYHRINGETIEKLLNGDFNEQIERFVIMDCRYDYEYVGGHIRTAINMSPSQIYDYFRDMPDPIRATSSAKRFVVVMHCEFSSARAPQCISLLRNYDRATNHARGIDWPLCSYPDVYLLDGGYKKFFETHPHLCDPIAYIPEVHGSFASQRASNRRDRKEQLTLKKSSSFCC